MGLVVGEVWGDWRAVPGLLAAETSPCEPSASSPKTRSLGSIDSLNTSAVAVVGNLRRHTGKTLLATVTNDKTLHLHPTQLRFWTVNGCKIVHSIRRLS